MRHAEHFQCICCEDIYAKENFQSDMSRICNTCLFCTYDEEIILGWHEFKPQSFRDKLIKILFRERAQYREKQELSMNWHKVQVEVW